jgi:antitoxin VapB
MTMGIEFEAKVFRSGNSVALRLPKALGLREGDVMRVRQENDQLVARAIPRAGDMIDLTGIYGSIRDIRRPPMDDNPRDWGA